MKVLLGERSYDILIEGGALGRTGERLPDSMSSRRCAIVTNQSLAATHATALRSSLELNGYHPGLIVVPDGEGQKSFDWAIRVIDELVEQEFDRRSFLVALGGGVIGDLTGFVSAIYMRGIDFVQVPTTLLAQVDASVGGKVAVNHRRAKNLVGAFHQPRFVLIDPLTLRTLPARELRSGLAEVIKHGIIADEELFVFLERNVDSLLNLDPEALTHVIERSCQIKAQIVAQDERDEGERVLLNYGHTVGHAIEACAYGRYTHGEAVAMGMSAAARIAARMGMVEEDFVRRQDALLTRASLPVQWTGGGVDEVLDHMRMDKKAESGRLRFVLPIRIGHAQLVHDVPTAIVQAALEETTE